LSRLCFPGDYQIALRRGPAEEFFEVMGQKYGQGVDPQANWEPGEI
jgi:hypothetical protein